MPCGDERAGAIGAKPERRATSLQQSLLTSVGTSGGICSDVISHFGAAVVGHGLLCGLFVCGIISPVAKQHGIEQA
jgi:hypothetical protein